MVKENDKCIVILLGTAQDAGIPQVGCSCANCSRAIMDNRYHRCAASLGILNPDNGNGYLIDATPDFKEQMILLKEIKHKYISTSTRTPIRRGSYDLGLGGIFLTHAHMGHYIGLLQLGKEGCSAESMPIYLTRSMKKFLAGNQPFKDLIKSHHVIPQTITPGKACLTEKNLAITPIMVQHRHEYSDCVGFLLAGPNKRLLYVPDMDVLTRTVLDLIPKVDIAILDGTFYSGEELPPHRNLKDIPHPTILKSMRELSPHSKRTRIHFTHFNHTNPVLDPDSDPAKYVKSLGFGLVPERWTFRL